MIFNNLTRRRRARNLARLAAVFSAAMLVLSFVSVFGSDRKVGAVTGDLGAVTITTPTGAALTGGGSATEFSLVPPSGASCEGGAAGVPSYRWQTFLVSASVNVAALTYASGPQPVSGALVSPLFESAAQTAVVNKNPSTSPLGLIAGIPTMSFAAFAPAGTLPAGDYKLGFACTKTGVTDSYAIGQIAVADDANDPLGFVWTVSAVTPTTTTTSTTTTAASTTTTTTIARSTTTTTTAASTTTTIASGTTTTIPIIPVIPTLPFVGSQGATGGGGTFPVTGSSSVPIVIWAILLLVFGRMAILLARPLKVVQAPLR